jgi:hypothetical protein
MSGGRANPVNKSFNDRQANGGRRDEQSPNGGRRDKRDRNDQSPNGGRDRKRKEPRQASETTFKVVAGKDRCQVCGDYTNHYGKGPKLCAAVGHRLAKPKGYAWKDSDKEPKIDIPHKEYQELKKTKASIFEANAKNRVEYRATNVSKREQYSSSASVAHVDAAEKGSAVGAVGTGARIKKRTVSWWDTRTAAMLGFFKVPDTQELGKCCARRRVNMTLSAATGGSGP